MSKQQVAEIAVEWATSEGWNPGLSDVEAFYAADNKGFYAGLLDDQPISCISLVKYPDNFAFLGFYIVKPKYRGKGFGLKIWQNVIKNMDEYNIGLDGVIAQQENYKKSGFKLAHRNIRQSVESQKYEDNVNEIVLLENVPAADLIAYDSDHFPTTRESFIKQWIKLPDSKGFALVTDNKINGYIVIRKCRLGYKIGPLFANNFDVADALYRQAVSSVYENEIVFLDTPEVNDNALKLAKKYKMTPVFETARMYTKTEPDLPISEIFGVTTFELG